MTAQFELPCWTKSHPRKSSWSFWKTGYRNLTRSRCICCMNQSFWYVHFGTSPLLDSSAVSSFRNQPASKYHFTAWPACLCMLVLTHEAVSIPGLLVMPWPHDDMGHGLNRSCYKHLQCSKTHTLQKVESRTVGRISIASVINITGTTPSHRKASEHLCFPMATKRWRKNSQTWPHVSRIIESLARLTNAMHLRLKGFQSSTDSTMALGLHLCRHTRTATALVSHDFH